MIPSTNTKLLVSEDWKKVYQSFRNADFKSYDFETLRRTMISYLQEKYPEEFNDFIDSSEYIALIDVIAYLGQNLSFRIDLNARENFLETAQRRDSILRLAQLISYNPKRNVPASGFLKVTAVSTTDSVFDSNGTNLANVTIGWNDPTNSDWYQQFINIMNSAMASNFGNPASKATIDSVATEQYRINSSNADVPIFSFSKSINGTTMNFEVVPATFSGKDYVYEEAPAPANAFSIIYKNDNQGSGSANTGFFSHFKQGSLSVARFSLDNPVPNEIVGVNTPNINNTDTWLWQLDKNGEFSTLWAQAPSLLGNNVIYNSLNKNLRSIYAISTRDQDQVDLNFADGIFGDLPKGDFRLFYRQSNGLSYVVKPEQMSGVVITVPYTNAIGQSHSLQMTLSLQYSVTNSSGPESNLSIQTKAPQSYYTQNRMITGEDYNIAPLTAGTDILKVKSVNRISSGLSKYFDLSDVSGRYSKTNIFATDGILYKEETEQSFEFEFTSRNQVLSVIKNKLNPIIASPDMRSFYLANYDRFIVTSLGLTWTESNSTPGESRGYLSDSVGPVSVGSSANNALQYVVPGSIVKFLPPAGKYFDQKNALKTIPARGIPTNGRLYIWATVKQVVGDGSNYGTGNLDDGTGPIIFSTRIPSLCTPEEVIYKFDNILSYSIETEIANICMTQRNFGVAIDATTRQWGIVLNSNLDVVNPFSLLNQNNTDDQGIDASWLIAFVWTGKTYKVRYRILEYIFESELETAFFNDTASINYDFTTNSVIKDKIVVLSINAINSNSTSTTGLGYDHAWQIDGSIIESDGYVEPKKVKVSFYDYTGTGQIADPNSFDEITESQFVYFKQVNSSTRYTLTNDDITPYQFESNVSSIEKTDGQLFYFYDPSLNVVKYYSKTEDKLFYTDQYYGRAGRSDIKFHYEHNSGDERRIDPSKSNLIDIYVLTTTYDNDIRSWLLGNLSTKPVPPTSQSLEQNYLAALTPIKAISDEIIFHPVSYKVLFGSAADVNLRAKFKAVKNPDKITTDNDIKTRILSAINEFFSLEYWEFGQSFHFGELSTYVMNLLSPDITNFVIVPITSNSSFGSLFEVTCLSNELFVSGAQIVDIEIIDAITASQLKSSSSITTTSGT
jgi:predicted DNA binding protein